MAEWQTPKTDWSPADAIGMGDLNRIEGNEVYLKEQIVSSVHGKKLFTSNGAFTVPEGVRKVWVSMCGGGGGGQGGGGAAAIFCREVTVTPGSSIYVTIGEGGSGGGSGYGNPGNSGSRGGTTYFGSHLSAGGGHCGAAGGDGGVAADGSRGGGCIFGPGGGSNANGSLYGSGGSGGSGANDPGKNGAKGMCLVEW